MEETRFMNDDIYIYNIFLKYIRVLKLSIMDEQDFSNYIIMTQQTVNLQKKIEIEDENYFSNGHLIWSN